MSVDPRTEDLRDAGLHFGSTAPVERANGDALVTDVDLWVAPGPTWKAWDGSAWVPFVTDDTIMVPLGRIDTSAVLRALTVQDEQSVTLGRIDTTATLRALTVQADQTVTLGRVDTTATLRALTVDAPDVVDLGRIDTSLTQRVLTVQADQNVDLGRVDTSATLRALTVNAGTAFTPADLDNQIGWWDVTEATPVTDGNPITSVADQFGVSGAVSASSGSAPTYKTSIINGLSVARWTADKFLFCSSGSLGVALGSYPVSVWGVARLDSLPDGNNMNIWDLASNTPTQAASMKAIDAATDYWAAGNSPANLTTATTGWHTFVCIYRATGDGDFWIDGTEYNTPNGGSTPTEVILGRARQSVTTAYWRGDIAEVGVVEDELTSGEVSGLIGYLETKYNL